MNVYMIVIYHILGVKVTLFSNSLKYNIVGLGETFIFGIRKIKGIKIDTGSSDKYFMLHINVLIPTFFVAVFVVIRTIGIAEDKSLLLKILLNLFGYVFGLQSYVEFPQGPNAGQFVAQRLGGGRLH